MDAELAGPHHGASLDPQDSPRSDRGDAAPRPRPPIDAGPDARPLRLLLVGGGSGGHVLPGLAVAEAFGETAICRAVCSDRPLDAEILDRAGVPHLALPARPPSLQPRRAVQFARGWRLTARRTRAFIREHAIDVVLATGGFVSPPAAWAARRAGVPVVALCLDVVPGRAIRLVGRLADRRLAGGPMGQGDGAPAGSGPGSGRAPSAWRAATVTGVPIRRDALAPDTPAACRTALGLHPDRPTLLVTGASQGARTLDDLAAAVASGTDRPLDGWQVIHLTGGGDASSAAAAAADAATRWARADVPAVVRPFLDRMGLAWGAADLALSRAGAGSVAEASANRVPTIFMPYPWHADQHQARNAAPLAAIGGAEIRTDHVDPARNLADAGAVLRRLAADPSARDRMRTALSARPSGPAAAEAVATQVRLAAHAVR